MKLNLMFSACFPGQVPRDHRRCMRRDAAAEAFAPNVGQDDITRPSAVAREAGKPAVTAVPAVARSGAGLATKAPAGAGKLVLDRRCCTLTDDVVQRVPQAPRGVGGHDRRSIPSDVTEER